MSERHPYDKGKPEKDKAEKNVQNVTEKDGFLSLVVNENLNVLAVMALVG
ncbi:hypothetical protein [Phormidium sp. CCY1219]|nr:hypothetical protein [Phormidium sp. CCY1219]MEB3827007.1 hypothetical protein [Phormidium sp. CCY1219]